MLWEKQKNKTNKKQKQQQNKHICEELEEKKT